MFIGGVRGVRGMRGVGEYVARSPQDWKLDNWIGANVGGTPVPAPGMSTATEVAIGGGAIGLAALAAAAWWYFSKK